MSQRSARRSYRTTGSRVAVPARLAVVRDCIVNVFRLSPVALSSTTTVDTDWFTDWR